MFTRAVVRPPSETFADGLTTAGLGSPSLALARTQHARYVTALESCGLAVNALAPDDEFPDSTFVEDTAVLLERCAVIARPGAASRRGETAAMRPALAAIYARLFTIEAPGVLDGGDVCAAGEHVFIGLSARTNEAGARQLAEILAAEGLTSALVDVRAVRGLLHLKSGLAWLGGRQLAAIEALRAHPALAGWTAVRVEREEEYAANCVLLGERVLVPAGHPRFEASLCTLGLAPLALDMSEFRKMDGGVSCLSLRC